MTNPTTAIAKKNKEEAAAATPKRLENTTACLPIVHGSVAYYLGKKAKDEFQTHQWTLYLRGPNNEDLSCVISKVIFQLHASFAQPIREYTKPPYEVTEKGWGEFDAQIRIIWNDNANNEQTTMMNHGIKLYPPGTPANTIPTDNTETPVVAETYDEVVFTNPTESFFRNLQSLRDIPTIESDVYTQSAHFGTFSDTENVHALLEAQQFLKEQIQSTKERLKIVDEELVDVEESMLSLEQQQQQKAQQKAQQQAQARAAAAAAAAASAATAAATAATSTTNKKSSSASSTKTTTANNKASAVAASALSGKQQQQKAGTTKTTATTTAATTTSSCAPPPSNKGQPAAKKAKQQK